MYVVYLAVAAAIGALLQILFFGGTVANSLLAWLLGVQVGLGGIWAFLGHYFKSDEIAGYIGWPPGNPFQKEIAFTNLGLGICGILSFLLRHTEWQNGFWLATIVVTTVFLGGAFSVHVADIKKSGNTNPGNAGPVFFADILVPVVLWVLFLAGQDIGDSVDISLKVKVSGTGMGVREEGKHFLQKVFPFLPLFFLLSLSPLFPRPFRLHAWGVDTNREGVRGDMLDIKFLRENIDIVRQSIANRGGKVDLAEYEALDKERRGLILEVETCKMRRNEASKAIAQVKREGGDASAAIAEQAAVGQAIKDLDERLKAVDDRVQEFLLDIPNVPHESVPVGRTEDDNAVSWMWGEKPEFSFAPKEHYELGQELGGLDFERAAKLSGSRFAVTYGWAAKLERALATFMLDVQTGENGYFEVATPVIVNSTALYGTGQLPKFAEDLFKIDGQEAYLIPTAEVPLTNLHADETIDADRLPIGYCAHTQCFRSEAGSYGKDTKGLIRMHQFGKVELVHFTRPEDSFDQLEKLVKNAESILQKLGLHYRVVTLCTGDLGFSSTKTYDIEVWLPGQDKYREISSCSNMLDFQARRAGIRFKDKGQKKAQLCHTLNGSGLAVGRCMVAVLENYQREDGCIEVPEVLRPYLGVEVIEPIARFQRKPTFLRATGPRKPQVFPALFFASQKGSIQMELDHMYICVGENAPEGDALVDFGLKEGSSNTHPGQGTANRRFFFHNFMLELLWFVNPTEVRAEITRPIRLHESLLSSDPAVSRFGMGFRAENNEEQVAPFPFVHYRPQYLPEPLSIQVGSQRPATEPNYFFLNFVHRKDQAERTEPIAHPNGLRCLTSVKVWLQQDAELSETGRLVDALPGVHIVPADAQLLELEFDNGGQGLRKDFRPLLPLVVTG